MKRSTFTRVSALALIAAMSFSACSKKEPAEIKVRHKEIEETTETSTPTPVQTEPEPTEPDPTDEPLPEPTEKDYSKVISVFTYSDETVTMCETYLALHPECEYEFEYTEIATDGGAYTKALKAALEADNEIDLFLVDQDFGDVFINGEYSDYVAGYDEFGIDIDVAAEEAGISQYIVDAGTRSSDGKTVGLSYTGFSGVMIYRTDIAEEVFGTSDPDKISDICGGNSGSLTKLLSAGDKLVENGYALCSGASDLWFLFDNMDPSSWYQDGKLYISEEHDAFFDFADTLRANNYTNDTSWWTDPWNYDMNGSGERPVFAFFGPAWMIEYVMKANAYDTAGLWNITDSPVNFWYGDTMLITTESASEADSEKREAIGDFLTWAFLDTSPEGWQYMVANGAIWGTYEPVSSSVVMEQVYMPSDFLGGQDMSPIFIRANEDTEAGETDAYKLIIGSSFLGYVNNYANGIKTKEKAMEEFLKDMNEYLKNYT